MGKVDPCVRKGCLRLAGTLAKLGLVLQPIRERLFFLTQDGQEGDSPILSKVVKLGRTHRTRLRGQTVTHKELAGVVDDQRGSDDLTDLGGDEQLVGCIAGTFKGFLRRRGIGGCRV